MELGDYTQPIATKSPEAQRWFDRGCVWAAGFHREEASRCFSEAIQADGSCCMAHWGLALMNGPDYNFSVKQGFYAVAAQPEGYPSLNVATTAAAKAVALAAGGPPREEALARALATRYEWPVTDGTPALQERYAEEMEKVALAFASDADVQAVCAEALLCLSPWDLYEKDQTPTPVALRVQAALERGLRADPSHLWLCHLKVHYNEMGPVDAFDWHAANVLRRSGVEAGHLIHMPTHLDVQVGDYRSAITLNQQAVALDLKLHAISPLKPIYLSYTVHNMEFCAWAAMYAGCREAALGAATQIDEFLTDEVLRAADFMPTFNELFLITRLMALIRFGLWAEILATPFRPDPALYAAHTLFLHYARGVALGATGDAPRGRAEEQAFLQQLQRLTAADRRKHNVDVTQMGAVAADVLAAELSYREGSCDEAFGRLEDAVAKFDALPYDEPHGWLISPRQTLGALLTEQARHERAMAVYRQDLALFPGNVWSLTGLRLCYLARADPRLRAVERELEAARELADVPIGASCACALRSWDASAEACCGP